MKDKSIRVAEEFIDLEEDGRMVTRRMRPGDTHRIVPGQKDRTIGIEKAEVIAVSTPEPDDLVRLDDKYVRIG